MEDKLLLRLFWKVYKGFSIYINFFTEMIFFLYSTRVILPTMDIEVYKIEIIVKKSSKKG
jgi:hypothetical protein